MNSGLLYLTTACLDYIIKKSLPFFLTFVTCIFNFCFTEKQNSCGLHSSSLLLTPFQSVVSHIHVVSSQVPFHLTANFHPAIFLTGLAHVHSSLSSGLCLCFLLGSKPVPHLRPSNFSSYNNPQYTSPLTPDLHSLRQSSYTILCPKPTFSYITSFKSQKLISKTCSSTEYSFPNYFITETTQYSFDFQIQFFGQDTQ